MYINISCKCDTNRAGHFTLDAYASRPVACFRLSVHLSVCGCNYVCPSVRLSVTPFWLCSHHRIILKFSGVITNDQRKVHAKGSWQLRSNSPKMSVCPSVRLSVTPFWLCSHHRIILKFSGVITNDQRKVHAKGQGQRSKVKVTEVTTQLNRFRTVTPVWIHIWWWNDAYSLMLLRRGALWFFKVIRQISWSHGSKNRRIWPRLGISGL